jgi:hypothetical protein
MLDRQAQILSFAGSSLRMLSHKPSNKKYTSVHKKPVNKGKKAWIFYPDILLNQQKMLLKDPLKSKGFLHGTKK